MHVRQENGRFQIVDKNSILMSQANRFLNALYLRGMSPHTIRAYAFDIAIIYRWLDQTKKQLAQLKQSDLLSLVDFHRRKKASPHSINRRLTTCRQFYRFLFAKELEIDKGASLPAPYYRGRGRDRYLGLHQLDNLSYRQLRVKAPKLVVEPLRKEQVLQFLRSIRRYRDLAIVYLMLLCGLRSKEVLSLKTNDIELQEGQVRVHGKGNKERLLPLPNILCEVIADYNHLERPFKCCHSVLFVVLQGRRKGQPMTPAGFRSLFRHRRLSPAIANANPHRMRHTFGTEMARAGVRLPTLQKMMGHAFSTTTLQYINLSMADITDEYHRAIKKIQCRYESN